MILFYILSLSIPACAQQVLPTGIYRSSNSTSSLPEQLFLDLRVQDVLDNTAGMSLAEPWATKYVESLRDGRYGDAIWARNHIAGDMKEGIIDDDSGNKTVLEVIEEDAPDYRVNDADLYTDALTFYSQTSNEDSHATDVLALLRRVGKEDITELEKDYESCKTFGNSCSRNNLGSRTPAAISSVTWAKIERCSVTSEASTVKATVISEWARTEALRLMCQSGLLKRSLS